MIPDLLEFKWFAVVNDLIGGWSVSNVDKPSSDTDSTNGEYEIGCFLSEGIARHVAASHNDWLDRQ